MVFSEKFTDAVYTIIANQDFHLYYKIHKILFKY